LSDEKFNEKILEKIDQLIAKVESVPTIGELGHPLNVTRPINTWEFTDKLKVISSDVHYVTLPKVKVVKMAGLKKGDYVKVIIIPLTLEEVGRYEQ